MNALQISVALAIVGTASVVGGVFFRAIAPSIARRWPGGALDKFVAFMLLLCNDVAGAVLSAQAGKSVVSPLIKADTATELQMAKNGYVTYYEVSSGIGRDGAILPLWDDLPPIKKAAWLAATSKVPQ